MNFLTFKIKDFPILKKPETVIVLAVRVESKAKN